MFHGATVQGHDTYKLWVGTAIAGIVVAGFVYLLIFWAIFAYRRRGNDGIPRQFRENYRLEILYTVLPLIIVAGLFYFTVITENKVDAVSNRPDEVVNVVAFRWGWRFIYADGAHRSQGVIVQSPGLPQPLPADASSPEYPQLLLPIGSTIEIDLSSIDVIHGFYVPEFDFSRQAIPGIKNVFDFTPTRLGVFRGECVQYCGLYHSEMLFSVRVVSQPQFRSWLTAAQAAQATHGGGAPLPANT